jgi:hypothetical protein
MTRNKIRESDLEMFNAILTGDYDNFDRLMEVRADKELALWKLETERRCLTPIAWPVVNPSRCHPCNERKSA